MWEGVRHYDEYQNETDSSVKQLLWSFYGTILLHFKLTNETFMFNLTTKIAHYPAQITYTLVLNKNTL